MDYLDNFLIEPPSDKEEEYPVNKYSNKRKHDWHYAHHNYQLLRANGEKNF